MTPLVLCSPLSLILVAVAAMSATSLRAEAPRASVSPFQSQRLAAPVAATPAALEFRGITRDAAGTKFRLYDPVARVGAWIALNEHESQLDVTAIEFYDPAAARRGHDDAHLGHESVVVDYQGRRYMLPLRTEKIASAAPLPRPAPPVRPATTNTQPRPPRVNPRGDSTAAENTVAQEIARRRAERERAAAAQPAKAK